MNDRCIFEELTRYGNVTAELERLPLGDQNRLQQMRDRGELTMTARRDGLTEIKET